MSHASTEILCAKSSAYIWGFPKFHSFRVPLFKDKNSLNHDD